MSPALRWRSIARPGVLLALTVCACQPPPRDTSPPPATTPSSPAPPAASASQTAPPAQAEDAPGPAYVLIHEAGVLRIDDSGVTTALPLSSGAGSWGAGLALDPSGDLWMSDWRGITVLPLAGAARALPRPGTQRFEGLAIRSASDAWAVTSDTEWAVMHYDGAAWSPVRRRSDFAGAYSDNKWSSLAVTRSAVWVSSLNGVWRGAGGAWAKIDPPAGSGWAGALFVYRDRLIATYSPGGAFLRENEAWRRLPWPADAGGPWAVSDLGFGVALSSATRVAIRPLDAEGPVVESDVVHGDIRELEVDRSGRIWVSTDHVLAVLDRRGRRLAEWAPGTLPGFTGELGRVAVRGAGPARLPAPGPAPSWDLGGRMQTSKSHAPLANAELELCPLPDAQRGCTGASFVRTARTRGDGSFRLADVPPGLFRIHVRPPADNKDCGGVFRVSGHTVRPGHDCKASPGDPRLCDLGVLTECFPFEMPPR